MDSILEQITDWLKEMMVSGIMQNLSGMFDSVNQRVGDIATQVGTTPAAFSPGIFGMIRNVSESVIVPIAGMILTFIACYELIQMIIDHNNLANFETWIFFKWVFKTFLAVTIITNCFNITMAVFDVSQHVIAGAGGIIAGSTAIDAAALEGMQATVEAMDLGPMFGLYLQSFIVQTTMWVLGILIFVIVYGRMIEIYLMVSLAPIPFSTFGNREQSQIGQNYLRSLFAIGFQGFLILVCVGIYAVLIQSIAFSQDIMCFMRNYAERYDWLEQTFQDWSFTFLSSFLFYEEDEEMDEDTRDIYRQGMAAFGGIAPNYHIELRERPTIVWDFHSLLLAIQMMFSFMLADETSSLRLCKYCMKAFFAKSDDEDFCTPACEANYERENGS